MLQYEDSKILIKFSLQLFKQFILATNKFDVIIFGLIDKRLSLASYSWLLVYISDQSLKILKLTYFTLPIV